MRPRKMVLCGMTLLVIVCGLAVVPGPGPGPGPSAEAAMLMRAPVYVWDDGAPSNHNWSDELNWLGDDTYPSASNVGADIPYNSGAKWTVDKDVEETILQLKILEKVDFGGDETLTALMLVFNSVSGPVEVTVTGGTLIGNP